MIYHCCDELRRNSLPDTSVNGIDYLEVLDKQMKLVVHFVNKLKPGTLSAVNILISGGERIPTVPVIEAKVGIGDQSRILTVTVSEPGDFSTYTLRLIQDANHFDPPDGFDPILSKIEFSFKAECESDFDCLPKHVCPVEPRHEPEIDYLAKDYASFRRLMLDRLSVLMPNWRERNPADSAVALVELLAYVGDYLSYQQDAVATEAYLGTARRRISIRRHARLVDYIMHNGCNARTWVHIKVSKDVNPQPGEKFVLPKGTPILTRIVGQPVCVPDDPLIVGKAQAVFETMEDVERLISQHNEMHFYTWKDKRCCLAKGATRATLVGHYEELKPRQFLVFEEALGPRTGLPEDADPQRRHVVRLTKVVSKKDSTRLTDPIDSNPITEITEIEWAKEDALPFPFCISTRTDVEHKEQYKEDISVARGNIVLADYGHTVEDTPSPDHVPDPKLFIRPETSGDHCQVPEPMPIPPRYRPQLRNAPLTYAALWDSNASAADAMRWNVQDASPAISLKNEMNGDEWSPRLDLLDSGPDKKEFVVEIDNDGVACLRFGDNITGARPEPQTRFNVTYRVGNGVPGNVGAGALAHIRTNVKEILEVRNPLPARGGVDPERIEDVRQRAPMAFRTQERAVTSDDYEEVAQRLPDVQRTAATFRWTGSWHTVYLTVDRMGGLPLDSKFEEKVRGHVENFRMAGYDLEVDGPTYVPLEIDMFVCVKPDYFRSQVKSALADVLSSRILPDGRRGVFHPDNFTFGQTVYLSPLYAAAQAVPGVASVEITKFQRLGRTDAKPLEDEKLTTNRLQIPRLDNDPNFPEHGLLRLTLGGGK